MGGYLYTDLHDFNGSDGQNPYGRVVIDRGSPGPGFTADGTLSQVYPNCIVNLLVIV
jgi:hypothetical protein